MTGLLGRLYDRHVYDWVDLLTARWTHKGWWTDHNPGAVWQDARSLDDLGECTALWLEGHIPSQPGYGGPVDVDEDLAPGMTEALIAANRAGFVTVQSQGGVEPYDPCLMDWAAAAGQRAAVIGLTTPDLAHHLTTTLPPHLEVAVWDRPPRNFRESRRWARESGAEFGPEEVGGRSGLELWFAGCHPDAIDAAFTAWQVSIWDPQPGPNDLWPALLDAVSS